MKKTVYAIAILTAAILACGFWKPDVSYLIEILAFLLGLIYGAWITAYLFASYIASEIRNGKMTMKK